MTFKNSITAKVEYQNSRTLSLNSSAGQIVEYTSQGVTVGAGYTITDFNAIWRGKGGKQGTFNNDLKLRANFSFKRDQSLIRRIEQNFTQATSGTKVMMLNFSADYALSKGIIIADTKFEFGLDENGNIVIGDEMLTPDSSRFWPAQGYELSLIHI